MLLRLYLARFVVKGSGDSFNLKIDYVEKLSHSGVAGEGENH